MADALDLSDQEVANLVNIVANTTQFPWVVTNPLMAKLLPFARQNQGGANDHLDADRRAAAVAVPGGAADGGASGAARAVPDAAARTGNAGARGRARATDDGSV